MTDDAAARATEAAQALARLTGVERHDVAIVLGSGWVPAADRIGAGTQGNQGAGNQGAGAQGAGAQGNRTYDIPTTDLPGFVGPAVVGHAGRVRSITVGERRVLVFLGRTHLYEGRGVEPVVHGVRMAAAAGCRTVVLTNACGGLRPGLAVGDAVLVSDHLNLAYATPLLGPRFVDLSDVYSRRLRGLAREIDPSLAEGVYAMFHGPQYETPAEVRMAATLGADLVGMSTVLEAIAAHAEGCEVLGLSLVTNLAAGLSAQKLDHRDVLAAGRAAATRMGDLLGELVARL